MASNTYSENASGGSYLGKSVQIKGEISSDEVLVIEGKVTGNIKISKKLTIGKDGFVNGEINAEAVKIDGKAEGAVKASGKLEISMDGTFSGDLTADKLVIEDGAVFKGRVNLDT